LATPRERVLSDSVEYSKKVPVVSEYDFIVAGGGMAGFGAACAAASRGIKTLLLERLEVLGGAGSSGGVANWSYHGGPPIGQGEVFDSVLAGQRKMKSIGEENGYRAFYQEAGEDGVATDNKNAPYHNTTFDHATLPIILQHIATERGVDLLFSTAVVGACMAGGRLTEVIIHNRSLLQAVRGRVFLDGTGDGILSQHAGADILPVEDPKHPEMIHPSLFVYLRRQDLPHEQPVLEPEIDASAPEFSYGAWPEPGRISLKFKIPEMRVDTGSGQGYSDATAEFRRRVPEVIRDFQKNCNPENWGTGYGLECVAPLLGAREGRRIVGEYILTVEDVRAGRWFPDSVCFAKSVLDSQDFDEAVPAYQIPYRTLLVKGVENLFVSGRCFSADRLAMSSARVMATGCLMGQAAGIAAAESLELGIPIRDVDPRRIREALLMDAGEQDFMRRHLCP